MPKSDSSRASKSKASREKDCRRGKPAGSVRVDGPHETPELNTEGSAGLVVPPASGKALVIVDESAASQLELQASQLSTLLRQRQRDLDHREAALNSQAAQLEADARTARLWLDEQRADLAVRGDNLHHKEQDLAVRIEALAKREENVASKQAELAQREQRLAAREKESLAREQNLARREQTLGRRECELEHRLARLEENEKFAVHDPLNSSDETLCEPRQGAAEKVRLEQATADLETQRQALQRRAEQVDQSQAALARLRDDLLRVHRETLEIRLVTEELWAQLSSAAPPAALTQSLGQIRSQLAEQYQQAKEELVQQRDELDSLRGELTVQYERLVEHKRDVERWITVSRTDCDRQAERVRAREQHLRREEVRMREQSEQWEADRRRYESELRLLRAQIEAQTTENAAAT